VSKAKLEALDGGRYRVSGVLDAVTAPQLLQQSSERFATAEGADIQIDLSGVAESDSSGLALLLEWLRLARHRKQTVHFANLPAQIAALARISEVEELFAPESADQNADRSTGRDDEAAARA
jgi:phospholipid transport system transporter-binding protein